MFLLWAMCMAVTKFVCQTVLKHSCFIVDDLDAVDIEVAC